MSCIISKARAYMSQGPARLLHTAPKMPLAIQMIHLNDLKVPEKEFFKEHKYRFHKLDDDPYDARREQLLFLMEQFPKSICKKFAYNYFTGAESLDPVKPLIDSLTPKHRSLFLKIKPFRQRAISSYLLNFQNNAWGIKRIPTMQYAQDDALVSESKTIDFRTFPRVISELDEGLASLSTFQDSLKGVSDLMKQSFPQVRKLMIHAHHIKLTTTLDRVVSNSPEGIHQDGFPFIVSALVVERQDVEGGTSEIFLEDKKTKVFRTTLQPGYGLLQPDLGSTLWHHVTPIKPINVQGYRTTLGFDIKILR